MEIELTAEQRAFRESCGKLAANLAARWHRGRGPHDIDPPTPGDDSWSRVVDSGWLAIGLREENGGAGASVVDLTVLAERLGYHAVPAPVLGAVIAAEQLQTWNAPPGLLQDLAEGGLRLAPALDAGLRTLAGAAENSLAWDAAGAEAAVIPATGVAHALGDALPFADPTRAVRPLGAPSGLPAITLTPPGEQALARLGAFTLSLLTADLLGTMQAALDAAIDHARTREQFGAPIGSFQAVQQLLADGHVLVEATRSASYHAAWAVDALPGAEALRAARVAKAFASRSAVEVCESAVQVFGGIGMTWEAPAHIWLRRAHTGRTVFGDEHHHQGVIADDDPHRS
ncbi:acyl-CoA dehydrogenase family protein [Nonomuraea cavernae]|uniref:Acyl-CoA dehydrogenase n=1 Tax=Nonomuraea cavernae TaxID=2045107 RepID=A0A918DT20_9ACTN|nr:acyl-CoA dehydrogenase family protein [Nonomuraea cavernae]MCA2186416.1 acyl-CoA/acyl-ACP dehydrogenase [Nonomuraea cavernae]GGO82767.1 acyl-CoA dehydrogenase [Nonomuraea cavernae]